jgi:NADH dehydrogenase [ubiquinone] 1 alpha subcomplex assembly factor 1
MTTPKAKLIRAALLACLVATAPMHAQPTNPRSTALHLTFDGSDAEPVWFAQNDNVMGGISDGRAELRDGLLHFTGALSFENNGGFAQVKIRGVAGDWRGKKGLRLRVLGDGRTYQLRLSTDARYRGSNISYRVEFPTRAGEWAELDLAFADLIPSHHGNDLDGPPVNLAQVEELSFLIADKRDTPFALKVDWIRTFD